MFLLDNNALKLAAAGEESTVCRIKANLGNIYISSVTAEEWLVSYMGGINRARSGRTSLSLPRAHEDFAQALEELRLFPLFVYSNEAEAIYRTFSPATLRVGAQDCRLAAQASRTR